MIFIKFRSTFLTKFVWTTMWIMLIFIVYNFERDSHILFINWNKFQLSRWVHKTFNKPSMGHWTGQITNGKGSEKIKKVEQNREKFLTFRTRLLCVCVEKEPFQQFNGKVRVRGVEWEGNTRGSERGILYKREIADETFWWCKTQAVLTAEHKGFWPQSKNIERHKLWGGM